MHDAEEAVCGDTTRIAKSRETAEIGRAVRRRIFESLGIPWPDEQGWAEIKRADNEATLAELKILLPVPEEWGDEKRLAGYSTGKEEGPLEGEGLVRLVMSWWTPAEMIDGIAWKYFIEIFKQLKEKACSS